MAPLPSRGILLLNLGSPDSPSVPDVRRYLAQFLMDKHVIDVPAPLRALIVYGGILPFRPKVSAAAYRSIWWEHGSPLVEISKQQHRLVQDRVDIPVVLGMRYGNPSVESAVRDLLARANGRLDKLLLVSLYPHYAMSSHQTAEVETREVLVRLSPSTRLTLFGPFHDDPAYRNALVANAHGHLGWDYDHLLMSYHGLPERHIKKSDPTGSHCLTVPNCCETPSPAHATCYRAQVFKTTANFVKDAKIPEGKYSLAFQSRLGRDPWLAPYTDLQLARFPSMGIKKLLVMCPAFVSDCLETLEEIGIRGRETFLHHGGQELRLMPCLNDHPAWIETLVGWCRTFQATGDAPHPGAGSPAGSRR